MRREGLTPQDLITDFQDWKSGHPDDHYLFGHDVRGIGSAYLLHAHMAPLTITADKVTWDAAWQKCRKRTSDRYVFYADGGSREGYLLVAVIDDPGAHAIWQNAVAVSDFEQVAEDFCVFGNTP